jgi:hypothetical protein
MIERLGVEHAERVCKDTWHPHFVPRAAPSWLRWWPFRNTGQNKTVFIELLQLLSACRVR